ncbi:MAG: hypothetical protein KAS70_03420 [Planctomycetes bacterium]|nr:hypothetical protein [Planctomycetota bacterium]
MQGSEYLVQAPEYLVIIDNIIGFLFSLVTVGLLTFMTWRVMNGFLSITLGRGIAFIGAGFSALLIMAAGLKISVKYLTGSGKIYILQGFIGGIIDTVNACFGSRYLSPLEFIVIVSFGLYFCYWLHTRFAPKHSTDDFKRKIDKALESDEPKRPYPY